MIDVFRFFPQSFRYGPHGVSFLPIATLTFIPPAHTPAWWWWCLSHDRQIILFDPGQNEITSILGRAGDRRGGTVYKNGNNIILSHARTVVIGDNDCPINPLRHSPSNDALEDILDGQGVGVWVSKQANKRQKKQESICHDKTGTEPWLNPGRRV